MIKTSPNQELFIRQLEQAEKEARESKELLIAAIETIEDGFVLYDADDRLVLCNKKYLEIYKDSADLICPGASFEEIIRKGAERGQYAEAVGRVDEWVRERMAHHLAANSTIEQRTGNGRWLKISERRLENGSIVGFRVDVTDYKNAEFALEEARDNLEKRVRQRTAELRDANTELEKEIASRKQAEAGLKRRNEYLSALHDISIGMFQRLDLSELLQTIVTRASKLTNIQDCFLHLFNTEENVLEIRGACGNYQSLIDFKIKPGEGVAGRVWQSGSPVVVEDYSTWSNRHPDPSFDFAKSIIGIPLKSGPKVEGVIGFSRRTKGMPIDRELISILEHFADLATIAIDNARLFEEVERELEKRVALEREKREMAIKLNQARKMESIGNLAGGIAHDFNNILSSIIGFTELTLEDVEKETLMEGNLQKVYSAGMRAKDLVKQILAFARQSEEKMKPIQMNDIVREATKFIRSSIPTTIGIKSNIQSGSIIMGNATQMHQVLMNLCTNAAHAMEEAGGVLGVSLKDRVVDKGETWKMLNLKVGDYMELMVSDTGTGIPLHIIDSIYEPYFTTKGVGEGTGMGLAMVHGIVESHGGRISVDSTSGEGTVFTVYLPVLAQQGMHRSYSSEELPSGTEKIIFVDDEPTILDMGRQILERLGYRVTTRTSSVEALELFRSKPDDFDLVITDMTMPNMTGDQLAVEVMKIRSDIPVILCTGYSKKIAQEAASGIGIKAFAYKPIVKADLAKTVRKVLDEQ